MKSTDSLDIAMTGLICAIIGLLLGEPFTEAAGSAIRFVGICTLVRGLLDLVGWCER